MRSISDTRKMLKYFRGQTGRAAAFGQDERQRTDMIYSRASRRADALLGATLPSSKTRAMTWSSGGSCTLRSMTV